VTAAPVRNVVLAANPSHATVQEHEFWLAVAERLAANGWILVEIAMRLLPPSPPAVSLSLPARLSELNLNLRGLPLGSTAGIAVNEPGWWNPEDYAIQEDWEYRRWDIDERLPAVLAGSMRLVAFVERALETLRPGVVLTTNKIDHNVAHFRRVALHRRVPTAIVERSPLDGIWLEPTGLFAESRIWDLQPAAGSDPVIDAIGRTEVARLRSNPQGFRSVASSRAGEGLAALSRPLVFLPMDNVLWTGWEQRHHPMRRVDNPLFASPAEGLAYVANLVKSRGGSLVIKPHPACRAIRADTIPEGAHLILDGLDAALRRADVVACFNTKVAFPALAFGKPVVTLAPNPVAASGATYHCLRAAEMDDMLAAALEGRGLEARLRRFAPFVGRLARDYFYTAVEPTPPLNRGPARFVDDILKAAAEPTERVDFHGLESLLAKVCEGTGARRIAVQGKTAEKDRCLPPERSLIHKALSILRHEGVVPLGRRSVLWVLARIASTLPPRVLARFDGSELDRAGVKSGAPRRIRYREDWRLLARPDSEIKDFVALWDAGLGLHSRVPASGCSARELERWNHLRGRFAEFTLWVIDGRFPSSAVARLVPHDEPTFLVDEGSDEPLDWRPTFYCTVAWSLVTRGTTLPEVERAVFLPQRFRGLFADPKILWFGAQPRSRLAEDDPPSCQFSTEIQDGLFFDDDAVVPALQIAGYLGFRRIRLVSTAVDERRSWLERAQSALAVSDIDLEILGLPPGSPC